MEITGIKHKVQQYILSILSEQKYARFRDMQPPKVSTNLYSYHLTQLLKADLVKKTDDGYTLDTLGQVYVDRLQSDRHQPKVVILFVIQNSDGDVLLQKQTKQPYIDKWTLPQGNAYNTDSTLLGTAQRVVFEKLKLFHQSLVHAGDCYVRVHYGDTPITVTLAHVYTFNSDDIDSTDEFLWVQPHKLHTLDLAPGIEKIIARTFFRDPFYFEEYAIEW